MKFRFVIFACILLYSTILTAGERSFDARQFYTASPYLSAPVINMDASNLPAAVEEGGAMKSKGRAFLFSLLLPGLGERYAGARGKAEVFMGAELTLWLGYFGFLTYGDWRTEEYENFAAAHAGIDPQGKPYNYFVNIGNYDNLDEYNAAKLRQRDLTQYYRDADVYDWQWDSSANRERFERIRKSAARADNNATMMLGAIFANHLISAIDAVWTVHKHNRGLVSSVDWQLRFGDGRHQPQVLVSVQKRF